MRAYRALLHLYPSSFRREYGAELAADFARRRRDRAGVGGIALWVAAIADVTANAARLHLELLQQDLKYAGRTFARTPGFVITAILVTALGIGATTAAFSVTNYVFLRPLPYADPDRLVTVWHRTPDYRLELSPPNFRDLKAQTTSFDALGAYHGFDANVVAGAEPDRLTGAAVRAAKPLATNSAALASRTLRSALSSTTTITRCPLRAAVTAMENPACVM